MNFIPTKLLGWIWIGSIASFKCVSANMLIPAIADPRLEFSGNADQRESKSAQSSESIYVNTELCTASNGKMV